MFLSKLLFVHGWCWSSIVLYKLPAFPSLLKSRSILSYICTIGAHQATVESCGMFCIAACMETCLAFWQAPYIEKRQRSTWFPLFSSFKARNLIVCIDTQRFGSIHFFQQVKMLSCQLCGIKCLEEIDKTYFSSKTPCFAGAWFYILKI